MVRWHHRLSGHEFEQTLGVGEGQGSLMCCGPWGLKESDTTEQVNSNLMGGGGSAETRAGGWGQISAARPWAPPWGCSLTPDRSTQPSLSLPGPHPVQPAMWLLLSMHKAKKEGARKWCLELVRCKEAKETTVGGKAQSALKPWLQPGR